MALILDKFNRSLVTIQTEKSCIHVYCLSDLHCDHTHNILWIKEKCVPSTPEAYNILLIPGDIATSLQKIEVVFHDLSNKYDLVMYVPGNHEAWCVDKSELDSWSKIQSTLELARKYSVFYSPIRVETYDKIDSVILFPLFSWYQRDWDEEPDPVHPIFLESEERMPFQDKWADYNACIWPKSIITQSNEPVDPYDGTQLSLFFASLNEAHLPSPASPPLIQEGDTVISFSHFLPHQALIPEKRFLFEPGLHRVSGSRPLRDQVRRLRPHLHLFGHTHLPLDLEVEGTRFIQWPLGYSREKEAQCQPVVSLGPLRIFRSEVGSEPLLSEEAVWSRHYRQRSREPHLIHEAASWVIEKLSKTETHP